METPLGKEAWLNDVLRRYPAPPRAVSELQLLVGYFLARAWPGIPLTIAFAAVVPFIWTLEGSSALLGALTVLPLVAAGWTVLLMATTYAYHRVAIRSGIRTTGVLVTLRLIVDEEQADPNWDDVTVEGQLIIDGVAAREPARVEFVAPWGPALREDDRVEVLVHPRSGRPLLILGPVQSLDQ